VAIARPAVCRQSASPSRAERSRDTNGIDGRAPIYNNGRTAVRADGRDPEDVAATASSGSGSRLTVDLAECRGRAASPFITSDRFGSKNRTPANATVVVCRRIAHAQSTYIYSRSDRVVVVVDEHAAVDRRLSTNPIESLAEVASIARKGRVCVCA
jgi:hypothetical protein